MGLCLVCSVFELCWLGRVFIWLCGAREGIVVKHFVLVFREWNLWALIHYAFGGCVFDVAPVLGDFSRYLNSAAIYWPPLSSLRYIHRRL